MDKKYKKLQLYIDNVKKETFEEVALAVFRYQAENNLLYQKFLTLLGVQPIHITNVNQIPFLPIQFFKYHVVKTKNWDSKAIFTSSGTTSTQNSQHHVRDLEWYRHFAIRSFENNYGSLKNYVVLALLPSYLERNGSSLVYMVQQFINESANPLSGFFLHDTDKLMEVVTHCQKRNKKVLLLGVTYALLDFAAKYAQPLHHIIIMETGGMKGKREEMTKEQVHEQLKNAFSLDAIHSEYGMTELLSQAYSTANGIFQPAPTMQILTRETTDPFNILPYNKVGGVNIIDLANLDTCSFIATDDLGRLLPNGQFQILGRFDDGDLRGCNLLVN